MKSFGEEYSKYVHRRYIFINWLLQIHRDRFWLNINRMILVFSSSTSIFIWTLSLLNARTVSKQKSVMRTVLQRLLSPIGLAHTFVHFGHDTLLDRYSVTLILPVATDSMDLECHFVWSYISNYYDKPKTWIKFDTKILNRQFCCIKCFPNS